MPTLGRYFGIAIPGLANFPLNSEVVSTSG